MDLAAFISPETFKRDVSPPKEPSKLLIIALARALMLLSLKTFPRPSRDSAERKDPGKKQLKVFSNRNKGKRVSYSRGIAYVMSMEGDENLEVAPKQKLGSRSSLNLDEEATQGAS